jgi:hypothetical protein
VPSFWLTTQTWVPSEEMPSGVVPTAIVANAGVGGVVVVVVVAAEEVLVTYGAPLTESGQLTTTV